MHLPLVSRARQVCLEVQHTRRLAAQARHRARLTCLARHMPQANLLTRAITAEILTQQGLLAPAPACGDMTVVSSFSSPAPRTEELSHQLNPRQTGLSDQLA